MKKYHRVGHGYVIEYGNPIHDGVTESTGEYYTNPEGGTIYPTASAAQTTANNAGLTGVRIYRVDWKDPVARCSSDADLDGLMERGLQMIAEQDRAKGNG
jgi:hypothetical protein